MNQEFAMNTARQFLSEMQKSSKLRFRARTVRKNGFFNHQMRLVLLYTTLKSIPGMELQLRRKERHKLANLARTLEVSKHPLTNTFLKAVGDMVVSDDGMEINKFINAVSFSETGSYYERRGKAIHPILEMIYKKLINDMRAQGADIPEEVTQFKETILRTMPRTALEVVEGSLVALGFTRKEMVAMRELIKIEKARNNSYTDAMSFPSFDEI